MANRYYQVALGGSMKGDVTEASSSSLGWVEVAITYDATGNNKEQALKAIEAVKQYIVTDTWPPV